MARKKYIYVKSKEMPSEAKYPHKQPIPVLPEWNRFTDYPKYSMVVYMGDVFLLRGTPNLLFVNVEGERYYEDISHNKCRIKEKPKYPSRSYSKCLSCSGYSSPHEDDDVYTCAMDTTPPKEFVYRETYHRSHYLPPDKDSAWICLSQTEDGPEYVPAQDTFGDKFELDVEDR